MCDFIFFIHFAGLIKSYSTHTYRVDGVAYQFTVDQTIKYRECAANPPTDIDNMKLHVTRTFLIYGESEQIVRYAATHRVSTAGCKLFYLTQCSVVLLFVYVL